MKLYKIKADKNKRKIGNSTIILGDFSISLLVVYRKAD
jgi:hypothetical protein